MKFQDEIIGTITKNEIIWRNKLLHWVGCNSNRSLSNIHLLDLAKTVTSSNSGEQRNSPFDLVLDYLDLNSLQSLSKTNRKCSLLVKRYVKQHSQQYGVFILTDEFFTNHNDDYKQLSTFAEYVTNLRTIIFECDLVALNELQNQIKRFYNLSKLFVQGHDDSIFADEIIVPHIQHFIFDCPSLRDYALLYELSCKCPDLETLELKQQNLNEINLTGNERRLKFRKLKKITLRYVDHEQHVQTIFKDTNTKLIFEILPEVKQ